MGRLGRSTSAAALAAIALAAPASAVGADHHVIFSADIPAATDNTLRAEIANAASGDTVIIDEGVFPSLAEGQIEIDKDLTIKGQGVNATAVTASGLSRIFNITGAGNDVTLEDLTLSSGRAPDGMVGGGPAGNGGNGGAVNNIGGHLILSRVGIRESRTGDGGANGGGVGGNGGGGGGVFSGGTNGDLDVIDSTIAGNSTGIGGDGIIGDGLAGSGGGIEVGGNSDFTITGSLVSGNVGGYLGGGIHSSGDSFTATNSTIYGNFSNSGGGIYEDSSGTATLTNVTIANNIFDGIARESNLHLVVLEDTLLLYNGFAPGLLTSNCGASGGPGFTQGGNSVRFPAEHGADSTPCPASIPVVDVGFGVSALPSLAKNGGPTKTVTLPAGSAAIDAIPAAECKTGIDQRGLPRPSGAGCDIGALEVQQPEPAAGAIPAGAIVIQGAPTGATPAKKCKKKRKRSALASKKKCKRKK